jgi:uncharacterized membrane protein
MFKKISLAVVGLMVVVAGTRLLAPVDDQVSANETQCQPIHKIMNLQSGMTLTGQIPIDVIAPTNATRVELFMDGKFLARTNKLATTGVWNSLLDTQFLPFGSRVYRLDAKIVTSDNVNCTTQAVEVVGVNTLQPPQPPFRLTPNGWTGQVNGTVNFTVDQVLVTGTAAVKPFIQVFWEAGGVGSVAAISNSAARYSAGPVNGTGVVRGKVLYAGQEWRLEAPVSVFTTNTTTTTPSTTTNANQPPPQPLGDSTLTQQLTTATSVDEVITVLQPDPTKPPEVNEPSQAIAAVLASDEQLKICMIERLGEQGVQALLRANRRPTPYEFNSFQACFAAKKNVVPSIFAPKEPAAVKNLPESKTVSLGELKNQTIKTPDDNQEKEVLVFSGKAAPGSVVLLYVFSEPLVLTTTADADGNWSYELEDPLAPGEHEVYAVVDRGDGEYERSPLASFAVQTASASESNPNGYGLRLAAEPTIGANNRSLNLFVASTVAIVGILLVITFVVLLRTIRKQKTAKLAEFSSMDDHNPDVPNE